MKMTQEQFIKILEMEANKQQIKLCSNILEQLYQYKELLLEWNTKINLTTITDDYDIIIKHIVDSLLITKYITEGQSVIDVGTGAGLPGIVLAIYFEGKIKVTLLDSSNKKINFLKDVITKLDIKNIYTINERAEEACHKKTYREMYDVAVARAVAKLNILSELLSGYVKTDGKCIFMKAGDIEEELIQAKDSFIKTSLLLEKEDKYEMKYLEEKISRTVIIAIKTDKLERAYPRNFGKIKNNPL